MVSLGIRATSNTAEHFRFIRKQSLLHSVLAALAVGLNPGWPYCFCYQCANDVFHTLDLSTLENNLKSDQYERVNDFTKDASKIFNNARYYNAKDSPIFTCAETLEKFFVHKLKELRCSYTTKQS